MNLHMNKEKRSLLKKKKKKKKKKKLLVACWCLFQLMRHCFQGIVIYYKFLKFFWYVDGIFARMCLRVINIQFWEIIIFVNPLPIQQ